MEKWLNALVQSKAYCGLENSRYIPSSKELSDINQFKRGVFLRRNIDLGETITRNDVYYAIPNLCLDGQLSSKHMSKYAFITAKENLLADSPLFAESIEYVNIKEKIYIEQFIHLLRCCGDNDYAILTLVSLRATVLGRKERELPKM